MDEQANNHQPGGIMDDIDDLIVNPGMIRDLYKAGLIDRTARDSALNELLPPRAWWTWADRILLMIGAALVLSGVIFFFAYNWEDMGKFLKFGVIQLSLLLCVIGGVKWHGSLVGRIFVLSAAVLTGPLLAVYGQTYQTGADAYELFTAWAVLIFGWVLAVRFAGLWIIWAAIVNAAVLLYWDQVADPNRLISWETIFIALALFHAALLAFREWGRAAGRDWLEGRWHRIVLLLATLFYMTVPVLGLIVDDYGRSSVGLLSLLLWAVCIAAGWYIYRCVRELLAVALNITSLLVVILTLIGKLLFEASDGAGSYLLFGLIVLGAVSVATVYLRGAGRAMVEEVQCLSH